LIIYGIAAEIGIQLESNRNAVVVVVWCVSDERFSVYEAVMTDV